MLQVAAQTIAVVLIAFANQSPLAQAFPTSDVFVRCIAPPPEREIWYEECRVITANSIDEANVLYRKETAGDLFFSPAPEYYNKLYKCSDVVGAGGTRGWWTLVKLNSTGHSFDRANAAFTCGHKTFEDAIKAGYIRAVASAKREIISVDIWSGIASPAKLVESFGNSSVHSPYRRFCLMTTAVFVAPNGVEFKPKSWAKRLPAVPIDPNSPDVGKRLVQACEFGDFTGVPAGFDKKVAPVF